MLGAAALLVVVSVVFGGFDGHRGSPLDWIRATVWVAGMAWRAPMVLSLWGQSVEEEDFTSSYDMTAQLSFAPVVLLVVALAALRFFVRRDEPVEAVGASGTGSLARSALVGSILASGWLIAAGISRAGRGFGIDLSDSMADDFGASVSARLGLNPWTTALLVLGIATVASLATRLTTRDRASVPLVTGEAARWLVALQASIRSALAISAMVAVVMAGYVVVPLVTGEATGLADAAPTAGLVGDATPWASLVGILNLVVLGGGFSMGSDIVASSEGALGGWIPSTLGVLICPPEPNPSVCSRIPQGAGPCTCSWPAP